MTQSQDPMKQATSSPAVLPDDLKWVEETRLLWNLIQTSGDAKRALNIGHRIPRLYDLVLSQAARIGELEKQLGINPVK